MNYVVIMAGGSGERFWPLSRMARPKQLLPLLQADRTMLQDAIDRITPIVPIENVLIITSEILRQPIIDATPSLPPENVIAEPAKRNTAPCLALAASCIAGGPRRRRQQSATGTSRQAFDRSASICRYER